LIHKSYLIRKLTGGTTNGFRKILNLSCSISITSKNGSNENRQSQEKFNAQKVTESGKNVYLYLERNEEELYNRTISKLQEENGGEFMTEKDTVFLNDKTGEIILKLIIQPEQVDSLIY
jgi:hypothetical protein